MCQALFYDEEIRKKYPFWLSMPQYFEIFFSGVGVGQWGGSQKTDFDMKVPLRKHAYSNILKILPPKNENFQIKKF